MAQEGAGLFVFFLLVVFGESECLWYLSCGVAGWFGGGWAVFFFFGNRTPLSVAD